MTLSEFAYELSHVSAYIAAFATGLVGYGFVRLAFRGEGLVQHLATGLLLMHVAVFTRTIYWDVARNFISESAWSEWSLLIGGTSVNTVFNVMVILAGYHSLKALRLAIPEEIRDEYSLIGAAFYPKRNMIDGIRNLLRGWAGRNGR